MLNNDPSIGDSDDDLGRMLAVLRFWFTKDLVLFHESEHITLTVLTAPVKKYVKGKPCKPYNSALGEFFRVCSGAEGCECRLLIAVSVTGTSKTRLPL